MTVIIDGTTGIQVPDGSGSVPSYSNDGDGNTGLFFPAADTVAFATSGSEVARFDSSGRLGVGTTSPSSFSAAKGIALQGAYSTSNALAISCTGASATNQSRIGFYNGNSFGGDEQSAAIYAINPNAGTNNGGTLVFAVSSNGTATTPSERARITDNGQLLVGTTSNANTAAICGQTVSGHSLIGKATDGSYGQDGYGMLGLNATRSASSAYNFAGWYSGDAADREFQFRGDGNGYADGTWNNNGADYAEFFESATGAALTVGATVVLDGNKVREATASDPVSSIMGVVRPKEPGKASMMVGNTAWNKWANKYLTDDFDRYFMEDHDVVEWADADGKQHSYESHNIPADVTVPSDAVRKSHDEKGNKFQHYKLNPAYNPDVEYIPREKRDEWIIVGLVGQVKVLKGKPVNDRWIKMRDVSATVEEWMIR